MTREPLSLSVDFNRLDDDEVLWVPRDLAPDAGARQPVILYDADGNRCLGIIKRMDVRRIYIKAMLSTWQDAHPVDVSIQGTEALTDALDYQVRHTVSGKKQQLTVGVNTDA
jgi:hypothetical protein